MRRIIKEELIREADSTPTPTDLPPDGELVFPFQSWGYKYVDEGPGVEALKKHSNFRIVRTAEKSGWQENLNLPGDGFIRWVPNKQGAHAPMVWELADRSDKFMFKAAVMGDPDYIDGAAIVTQGARDPAADQGSEYSVPARLEVAKGTGDWEGSMFLTFRPR